MNKGYNFDNNTSFLTQQMTMNPPSNAPSSTTKSMVQVQPLSSMQKHMTLPSSKEQTHIIPSLNNSHKRKQYSNLHKKEKRRKIECFDSQGKAERRGSKSPINNLITRNKFGNNTKRDSSQDSLDKVKRRRASTAIKFN